MTDSVASQVCLAWVSWSDRKDERSHLTHSGNELAQYVTGAPIAQGCYVEAIRCSDHGGADGTGIFGITAGLGPATSASRDLAPLLII